MPKSVYDEWREEIHNMSRLMSRNYLAAQGETKRETGGPIEGIYVYSYDEENQIHILQNLEQGNWLEVDASDYEHRFCSPNNLPYCYYYDSDNDRVIV
jgi:hypothetical protein